MASQAGGAKGGNGVRNDGPRGIHYRPELSQRHRHLGSSPAASRIPRSCGSWCRIDGERLPRTLKLYSTMGVVMAFSGVQVTGVMGALIAASRPANDPANQQTVIVKFRHALPPGTCYGELANGLGLWRPSWGRFQFTVS
jgi:hypothetical protein